MGRGGELRVISLGYYFKNEVVKISLKILLKSGVKKLHKKKAGESLRDIREPPERMRILSFSIFFIFKKNDFIRECILES